MAYIQEKYVLNSGSVINVSSIRLGRYGVYTEGEYEAQALCYSYSYECTEPSTLLAFPSVRSLNIIDISLIDDIFPIYMHPRPEEYFASEEYKVKVDILKSEGTSYWIMGDYESGGIFIVRTGIDTYMVCTHMGFYQRGDNFCYVLTQQALTYRELQSCRITATEGDINNAGMYNCPLSIWYKREHPPYSATLYKYKVPTISPNPAGYYSVDGFVNSNNFEYISNCLGTRSSLLVDRYPEYLFTDQPLIHLWDANFPSDLIHISGNWDGNTGVDEEGNPFINGGATSSGGGGGGYPNSSDTINFTDPTQFSVDVLSSGFLTLYNPSAQEVKEFNNFLFTGITDAFSDQLKKLISNPLEYLIFIAMCHFQPNRLARETISFAGISSGVSAYKIAKQYHKIVCGSITIPEVSKSFLDYQYSKVSIYLPYTNGIHELNIDDVMGAKVSVQYNINLLDGSCIAQVKCTRQSRLISDTNIDAVLYTFSGNCYTTIPVYASDWRGAYNSILGLTNGFTSIATGNVAGGVGAMADSVMGQKVSIQRAGTTSASFGYMDNQKPYLILERPNQNIPYKYGHYQGYTSNIYQPIKNLRGYTEVETDAFTINDFDNITTDEYEELVNILNGGFYI